MGVSSLCIDIFIGLVFLWAKRENKECTQYKHEKQGKNNIFSEFYQLVNKGVPLEPAGNEEPAGKMWTGKTYFLATCAT